MCRLKTSLLVLSLLVPGTLSAESIERRGDVEAICSFSEAVEFVFPDMTTQSLYPRRERSRLQTPAEGGTSRLHVDMTAPEAPTSLDAVLEFGEARSYARGRLERLVQTYTLDVPSDVLSAWSWDPVLEGVRAGIMDDFDRHGATFMPGDGEYLLFPMSEDEADELLAAHVLGTVVVRLEFLLAAQEQPWVPICNDEPDTLQVPVEIIGAVLVDGRSSGARWREPPPAWSGLWAGRSQVRHRWPGEGVPEVAVTSMGVTGPDGCTSDEAMFLQASIESLLPECYLYGLRRNTTLRGAMVVSFELSSDGTTREPAVAIDVLDSALVSECVLAALGRLRIPRADGASTAQVRSRIRFDRSSGER